MWGQAPCLAPSRPCREPRGVGFSQLQGRAGSSRQRAGTVWPLRRCGRVVWGGVSASSGSTSPATSIIHCVTNGTRRGPDRPRLGHSAHRLEVKAVAFDSLTLLFPCVFATEKDQRFLWPPKPFGSCLREASVHRPLTTKQRPFSQPSKGITSFLSP